MTGSTSPHIFPNKEGSHGIILMWPIMPAIPGDEWPWCLVPRRGTGLQNQTLRKPTGFTLCESEANQSEAELRKAFD